MTADGYATLGERELVAASRGDDRDAFLVLVSPHRRAISGICIGITCDRHLAERAVQHTLAAAWQYLDRFDPPPSLQAWLAQIAYRASMKDVAHRAGPATTGSPLAHLAPDYRAALVLTDIGALTTGEIAELQGVPRDIVISRIRRARQAVHRLA